MIIAEDAPKVLAKKLVAVLSEKLETGVALNTVAHMSLGMGSFLGADESLICDYVDADNIHHPSISAYPFIILKGRPTKIREALDVAKTAGIAAIDFVNTMTSGSYIEQLTRTKETPNATLELYGIVLFGEIEAVNAITRKFSLFK